MARPLRLEYEGAVYHVTSRGNAGTEIFLDDTDRLRFLEVLGTVVERFGWICHAYCLMTNHYHLLVETPQPNLSRGMQHLNGVYTQRGKRGQILSFDLRLAILLPWRDRYRLNTKALSIT
jgi:putative transposase